MTRHCRGCRNPTARRSPLWAHQGWSPEGQACRAWSYGGPKQSSRRGPGTGSSQRGRQLVSESGRRCPIVDCFFARVIPVLDSFTLCRAASSDRAKCIPTGLLVSDKRVRIGHPAAQLRDERMWTAFKERKGALLIQRDGVGQAQSQPNDGSVTRCSWRTLRAGTAPSIPTSGFRSRTGVPSTCRSGDLVRSRRRPVPRSAGDATCHR